jgi:hypothetical protein
VPAELVTGFDAFAGDPDLDAAAADPAPEIGLVVGLVGVQLGRLAPPRTAAGFEVARLRGRPGLSSRVAYLRYQRIR